MATKFGQRTSLSIEALIPRVSAPGTRPIVPSSPGAIAGSTAASNIGSTNGGGMSFFGALGGIISGAIGLGEQITGINVPFIGPGDALFGGSVGPAVPGNAGPLNVAGGPTLGLSPTTVGLPCFPPWFKNPITGNCELGVAPGGVGPLGGAPTQQQGSLHALTVPHSDTVPERRTLSVRRCAKGSVLGKDGWCHPKGTIANKQREWPRPRRPLLTSGDLSAISTASRAANRLKLQTKRLEKMGMLQKPRKPCPK